MLSKAYKSHSAALKLLVEFGAVVEIPWLQNLENFAGHYDKYLFITLRGGGGPLNGAITIEDNLLLEKLLKDGFFHDDYYSIKEEHSNMVQSWRTPLQFAVDSGNCKATNLLLKHGANINAPAYPDDGSTALQCAAQKGDLNMALDLLQLGAHINAPAAKSEGHTALECAALEGHLDLAQLLINNNSEIPNLRQDCKRASRIAKSKRHSVLATMLENHACKLAERLGVDHTDEIDNMCACDLNRISDPSCEKCHPLAQRSYYYPVHWEF
ncbi:ankyrin [Viridothelium virens]|uniref:Ankyrin n=1 Tax=Viridothelium virens TaxID=1048519 RepID=A0A6A6HG80_VIRVR|nr:ankyrin [Viridothelium virens]